MSRDRSDDEGPHGESFADLVGPAKRLGDSKQQPPASGRTRVDAKRPSAARSRKPTFRTPDPERPHLAAREGVTDATLDALARGEPSIDERIDLHGLDRESAANHLARSLESAAARGLRCVLVVHGQGQRSAEGGVLRDAVPDWLTARGGARFVLALAPAPAREGGAGATRVLLARA